MQFDFINEIIIDQCMYKYNVIECSIYTLLVNELWIYSQENENNKNW
jgi:hypothetical protein